MPFRFLASTFALLAILITPRGAWSQAPTMEQMAARVAQLERRVEELEQRLRILETQNKPVGTTQNRTSSTSWRNIDNWRKLKVGMTMDEVASILGRAEKVTVTPVIIFWYWGYPGGGQVSFDAENSKVRAWSEPDRQP